MQSDNRFFDELARFMTGAAGAAQGLRREVETMFRQQADKVAGELDLIGREEFDVMRDAALSAREEIAALRQQIADLESRIKTLEADKK